MAALNDTSKTLRRLYQRMFQRQEDARTREIVETLLQVPVFHEFPRSTLQDLADAIHTRRYKEDEFIYYERDPGLGMYVVQEGRVRLMTEDEAGAVHELRQASAREIFGDISILGDFRRMETAQAVTEVRLLGFFRPDLKNMIKRNPRSGVEVMSALARHTAARQAELVRLVAESDGKVAAMRLLDGATLRAE